MRWSGVVLGVGVNVVEGPEHAEVAWHDASLKRNAGAKAKHGKLAVRDATT